MKTCQFTHSPSPVPHIVKRHICTFLDAQGAFFISQDETSAECHLME